MYKISFTAGVVLFLLIGQPYAFSGNGPYPVGARSAGMSRATVMMTDFWSVFHNQGSLGFVDNLSAGVSYNQGSIPQMSQKFAGLILPVGKGGFSLSSSYYGYSKYYELKGGLAYGMKLADNLSAGVQIDYFNTHISDYYDNSGFLTFEAGLIYRYKNILNVGFHIFNPFHYQISDEVKEMPGVFRLGAGYRIINNLLICSEIEKELDKDINVKVGLEYIMLENIFLRTGVSTYPLMNTFGIGYKWSQFQIDLGFSRHSILGFQPAVSIHYQFNK